MPEYFIRLTPHDPAITLEDIEVILHAVGATSYVVSLETQPRQHFHAYLETSRSPENLRYQLKSHLNGQVYISGKDVMDKVRTIAYTIKDGNYKYFNLDMATFMMAKATTHKKRKFDDVIKEIIDTDNLSPANIVNGIILAHIEFNRKIYPAHIKALLRTIQAKRCDSYRLELVQHIVNDI